MSDEKLNSLELDGKTFGVIGVWIGMYIDWLFRSLFFTVRYFRGKWLERKVV